MEAREKIYNGLKRHHGSLSELAKRRQVSDRWVTLVLKGEQSDDDLILAGATLWHELEETRKMKLQEAKMIAEKAEALSVS